MDWISWLSNPNHIQPRRTSKKVLQSYFQKIRLLRSFQNFQKWAMEKDVILYLDKQAQPFLYIYIPWLTQELFLFLEQPGITIEESFDLIMRCTRTKNQKLKQCKYPHVLVNDFERLHITPKEEDQKYASEEEDNDDKTFQKEESESEKEQDNTSKESESEKEQDTLEESESENEQEEEDLGELTEEDDYLTFEENKDSWIQLFTKAKHIQEVYNKMQTKSKEELLNKEFIVCNNMLDTITLQDISSLVNSKGWLTQNILNTIGFLQLPPNALLLNSATFYQLELKNPEKTNLETLKFQFELAILKQRNVDNIRGIIIPWNVNKCHWNAIIITLNKTNSRAIIWNLEPYGSKQHKTKIMEILPAFLTSIFPKLLNQPNNIMHRFIKQKPGKHQQDSYACGVYVARLIQLLNQKDASNWPKQLKRTFLFSNKRNWKDMNTSARLFVLRKLIYMQQYHTCNRQEEEQQIYNYMMSKLNKKLKQNQEYIEKQALRTMQEAHQSNPTFPLLQQARSIASQCRYFTSKKTMQAILFLFLQHFTF